MTNPNRETDHGKRDSETLFLLGGFITILSLPVLIGTVFAETGRAMVVNALSGLLLLIIGLGFVYRARVLRKRNS